MRTVSSGGRPLLALLAAGMLTAGCGATEPPATPSTAAPPVTTTESAQERNLRLRERLLRLGCDTNSCLQTYFACMDGLLTGDACAFYREHPPG